MKNLASHYGWIVLVTLVMAVMVAFATPLGKYMGNVFVVSMNSAKNTLDHVVEDGVNNQNKQFEELFVSEEYQEAGLYAVEGNQQILDKTWDELTKEKIISVKSIDGNTVLMTKYDEETNINASSDALNGHLIIRNNIVLLPPNAFANCDNIDCVTLKGVDVVQKDAFKDCDKLTTIILERKVMEGFQEGAFNNCPNFNTIIFKGPFKQFKTIKFGTQTLSQPLTIICSDRTVTMSF